MTRPAQGTKEGIVNSVHAATTKPAEMTATEFRGDVARVLRDAHYGHPTLITNNGDPFAKVVHPDAAGALDPERIDRALRAVIAELDYDLHKALESDEETGEDTYHKVVADFIRTYQRPTVPARGTP